MKRKLYLYVGNYVRSWFFWGEKFSTVIVGLCSKLAVFIFEGEVTKEQRSQQPPFLHSLMSHHSNNSTTPTDKLLSRRENMTLISFHLAAVQKAWLINVCNEGYRSAQVFGSKGNLSLLCNCRASHITRLFSALSVNNSSHLS